MSELEQPGTESLNAPSSKLWTPKNLRQRGIDDLRRSGEIQTGGEPDQLQVLFELQSAVAAELNRHLRTRGKRWSKSDFLPIDAEGRVITRFEDLSERGIEPVLTPDVEAAVKIALETEEGLPWYHHEIMTNFDQGSAWVEWNNEWTAEEANHGSVIGTYLIVTGHADGGDRNTLAIDSEEHLAKGFEQGDKDPLHTLVYVAFQECATREAHRETAEKLKGKEPIAEAMFKRIAKDENLHMVVYLNLVKAALEIAPNQMMRAIADEVMNFKMPGTNIKGFFVKSLMVARAGIYDDRIHLERVVMPILTKWNIFNRTDLSGYGEQARDELLAFLDVLKDRATSFEERRDDGRLDKTIERQLARQALQVN